MHNDQIETLCKRSQDFCNENGVRIAQRFEFAAMPLLTWHDYLVKYSLTGHANELLIATKAAIREAAAVCALGAVRPSLFSLRGQIDLIFGWLYFKDHPVEYEVVRKTGDGFKLKKEIIKYFSENFENYTAKFSMLVEIRTRKEVDPYRLLSAHIHAQSAHVAPDVNALGDVICSGSSWEECVALQADVAEYLGDHLFASGMFDYSSLPAELTAKIRARAVSAEQAAALFR